MRTLTSNRRNCRRGIIAGAVLGASLALSPSVSTGASAQSPSPPANVQVTAPKQVGAWTVVGWSQGYCAAERPVLGAAGDGGTLQFVVARLRIGYRIALGSQGWELKPQTTFPIELVAQPVMRGDANAIAVSPKLVIIELGADGQFMKRLATAPIDRDQGGAGHLQPPDGRICRRLGRGRHLLRSPEAAGVQSVRCA